MATALSPNRRTALVLAVGLAVLCANLFAGWLFGVPLGYGFALPLGVFLGPVGAVGVALGGAVEALLAGDVPAVAVARGLSDLLLVGLCYALWNGRVVARPADSARAVGGTLIAAAAVALVATAFGSTALATLRSLVGPYSVALAGPALLGDRLLPAIVVGPPLLVLVSGATRVGVAPPLRGPRVGPARLVAVGLVTVAWAGSAFTLSLLRGDIVAFDSTRATLAGALPSSLEPIVLGLLLDEYWLVLAGSFIAATLAVTLCLWWRQRTPRVRRQKSHPNR
jgi:hypothetical protein